MCEWAGVCKSIKLENDVTNIILIVIVNINGLIQWNSGDWKLKWNDWQYQSSSLERGELHHPWNQHFPIKAVLVIWLICYSCLQLILHFHYGFFLNFIRRKDKEDIKSLRESKEGLRFASKHADSPAILLAKTPMAWVSSTHLISKPLSLQNKDKQINILLINVAHSCLNHLCVHWKLLTPSCKPGPVS